MKLQVKKHEGLFGVYRDGLLIYISRSGSKAYAYANGILYDELGNCGKRAHCYYIPEEQEYYFGMHNLAKHLNRNRDTIYRYCDKWQTINGVHIQEVDIL